MAATGPWPTIHAERAALAEDLTAIPDGRWSTPSLCPGWTVHQVLGQMVATAKTTPPLFAVRMLAAGLRFGVMTERALSAETAGSPADTLAEFRRVATSTSSPPGPVDSWLGEPLVHGEDIRRPLGLRHEYPTEALIRIADFYSGSNLLIGAKKRIAGATLRATDASWSHGSGPEAAGPLLSLVLAMTGRRAALDDLIGEGVDVLRSRP